MNNFDITNIEDLICDILATKTGCEAYGDRPKAMPHKDSFVVAQVSGSIFDLETYGSCSINVYLFTKDIENLKNSRKLSFLQDKMREALVGELDAEINGTRISLLLEQSPDCMGDIPDDFGYHARVFKYKTIIKSL